MTAPRDNHPPWRVHTVQRTPALCGPTDDVISKSVDSQPQQGRCNISTASPTMPVLGAVLDIKNKSDCLNTPRRGNRTTFAVDANVVEVIIANLRKRLELSLPR